MKHKNRTIKMLLIAVILLGLGALAYSMNSQEHEVCKDFPAPNGELGLRMCGTFEEMEGINNSLQSTNGSCNYYQINSSQLSFATCN